MAPSAGTASDPLPFVGRETEFHRVLSAVDAAAAGVGCLALVAGEAGIGKSTLLREVGAEAGRRGLIVRRGRAVGRATAPLWIWRRALAGTPAERELDELTDQSGDPDGSDDVWRALSIVFDELHRRPDARASVLLFDDLQWADSASLLLLSHVTAELPVMPVAVVGTHRPVVDTESPLAKLLAASPADVLRLELRGLDAGSLAELSRLLGHELDREALAILARRSGGNPFYATELLQHDSATAVGRLADIVLARVNRLSADGRSLLEAAAIGGETFDAHLAARVAQLPQKAAAAALDGATTARLLAASGDEDRSTFRFTHALVREAIDASLDVRVREHLHGTWADELRESTSSGDRTHIAQHLLRAGIGRADEARAAAVAAAADAHRLGAFSDTVELVDRAVAIADRDTWEELPRVLLLRGSALRSLAERGRAREDLAEAGRLARLQDDPELVAESALLYAEPRSDLGFTHAGSHNEATVTALTRALDLDDRLAQTTRVLLRCALARELFFVDPIRSDEAADGAFELRRDGVEAAALAEAVAAKVRRRMGDVRRFDELAELLDDHEEAARRTAELSPHRFAGSLLRIWTRLVAGDVVGADEYIARFALMADEAGVPVYQFFARTWITMRHLMQGDIDRASSEADENLAFGRRHGAGIAAATEVGAQNLEIARLRGGLGALRDGVYRFASEVMAHPVMVGIAAEVCCADGDPDAAEGWLTRLDEPGQRERIRGPLAYVTWWHEAMATIALGDEERAQRLYERGRGLSGHHVYGSLGVVAHGPADHLLGRLARLRGRHEDAITHLRDARKQIVGLAPVTTAEIEISLGEVLSAVGRDAEAGRLLDRAGTSLGGRAATGVESRLAAVRDRLRATKAPLRIEREADMWCVHLRESTLHLPDRRGLHDLARIVDAAGAEVHVLELVSEGGLRADAAQRMRGDAALVGMHVEGGAGQVLIDARARREYRARLSELDDEIAEAQRHADLERVARAKAERDALVDHLNAALGLGGRSRRPADAVERARKAVGKRIRHAIELIADNDEHLAAHLREHVSLGVRCSYDAS